MKTIIVGAGASGLACGIKLKQNNANANVTILERLNTPGKKILATGNGRCNLTNTNAENHEQVINFFNSIGLVTRNEEGRIYPYSLKAETVLEVLLNACENLGVNIITNCTVKEIKKDLTVITDCGNFKGDAVVVAAGGKAQKSLGSNGSGYDLLKRLGHTITPLSPALVQLTSSSKYPRAIKGTRTKCKISIEVDGCIKGSETGEILFTDYGISGIAAMNLSGIVAKEFTKKEPGKCIAVIDLTPDIAENELEAHGKQFGDFKGILGSKLNSIVIKQTNGDLEKCAKIIKNWRLILTGTKGFDFAQITSGGVPVNEITNFESNIIPNLYICGEILDKQFKCGGFNLDFAWHSGIETAKEITENDKN